MTASRLSLIPILIAAAGCEYRMTSRVGVQVMAPLQRARDDGTRDAPVGGAVISVKCPSGGGERLGSTDAAGWVLVTTRAPVGLDCDLAVDYRGQPLALVPVNETCSRKEAGGCRVIEVRLALDAKRDAPSPQPVALRARCEAEPHGDWVRCWRTRKPVTAEWGGPAPTFTSGAVDRSPR